MALVDEVNAHVNESNPFVRSSKITTGQKTVTTAGTAEPLVASSTPITGKVVIRALDGNTGAVYIGDDGVDSTNGYTLEVSGSNRSDAEVEFHIKNLNLVYLDVGVNGDGVSWLAEV